MKSFTVLLLLFALGIGANAQSRSRSVDSAIVTANQAFMRAFEQGATTLANLYTSDAQLFPPNGAMVSGNTQIGPFWIAAFRAGIYKVSLETIETEMAGNRIIETGNYTLMGTDGKSIDTGKYLVVWKQEGNAWKLYRDIWNTSQSAK